MGARSGGAGEGWGWGTRSNGPCRLWPGNWIVPERDGKFIEGFEHDLISFQFCGGAMQRET